MNLVINGHNIVYIILITFLASFIFTPIAKKIAEYVGALDIPNDRKVHDHPMPRLGGLAIFASFLLGYILYGDVTTQMLSILIGSFIILLVGIFDDIKPIKAKYKFLAQIVAATIVVIYGKIFFTEITFLGLHLTFNLTFSYILSILFVVAISNAINLIDGLDGLAGGISTIYFITTGVIAMVLNRFGGLDITLSMIMIGSTLGFLIHNFPPAKIFMGDSGSLFLGFIIAVISILGFKVATFTSLIIPITILAIPILDTILAIFRRLIKGESIGKPDMDHFHHQLLKLKFSNRVSLLIIYGINIIFSSISVFYCLGDTKIAIVMYLIALILLVIFVLKTNILYEHKNNNNKVKKSKRR